MKQFFLALVNFYHFKSKVSLSMRRRPREVPMTKPSAVQSYV